MKKAFTLGKQERLKSRKLIEQLFREGKSISAFPFRVLYLPVAAANNQSSSTALQMGVAVSSKYFKKAVHRNKIKRLTREAYRLQKAGLQQKLAGTGRQLILFFIYTGREIPVFLLVKEQIQVILNKLIRIIDENGSPHP
jgi:ribonuclease P protein component